MEQEHIYMKKQLQQMAEAAGEIEKIVNGDVLEGIDQIGQIWKGEAAIAYHNKGREIAEELLEASKALGKLMEEEKDSVKNDVISVI